MPLSEIQTEVQRILALDDAEAFVGRMPTEKIGLLFLTNGEIVQPDPDRLDNYETNAGRRRGHWPSSTEIANAMFERHTTGPSRQEPL